MRWHTDSSTTFLALFFDEFFNIRISAAFLFLLSLSLLKHTQYISLLIHELSLFKWQKLIDFCVPWFPQQCIVHLFKGTPCNAVSVFAYIQMKKRIMGLSSVHLPVRKFILPNLSADVEKKISLLIVMIWENSDSTRNQISNTAGERWTFIMIKTFSSCQEFCKKRNLSPDFHQTKVLDHEKPVKI